MINESEIISANDLQSLCWNNPKAENHHLRYHEPWRSNGYAYATDCIAMFRCTPVPEGVGYNENNKHIESFWFPKATDKGFNFLSDDLQSRVEDIASRVPILNYSDVLWHRPRSEYVVKIGKKYDFDGRYLARISRLPWAQIKFTEELGRPVLQIRFGINNEGAGFMFPMNKEEPKNV